MADKEEKLLQVAENDDGTAVVFLDDDGKPVNDLPEDKVASAGDEDEGATPKAADDHEDEDDETGDDKNAVAGETDEERRERRRQEKLDRRERQRRAREAKDRELAELRATVQDLTQRVGHYENRTTASDEARLESAIKEAAEQADAYSQAMSDAMKTQDTEAFRKAQNQWYQWTRRSEALAANKQQIQQAREKQAQNRGAPKLDAQTRKHAENWMRRNDWYDPNGGDDDSQIILSLDASLTRDGFDPRTQDYWDELDARAKKYLPNRYRNKQSRQQGGDEGGNGQQPRRTTGGSGREASPAGRRGFTLSKERVAAMKEAGIWDDPEKRAKQIRTYQEYDKRQAANARR